MSKVECSTTVTITMEDPADPSWGLTEAETLACGLGSEVLFVAQVLQDLVEMRSIEFWGDRPLRIGATAFVLAERGREAVMDLDKKGTIIAIHEMNQLRLELDAMLANWKATLAESGLVR